MRASTVIGFGSTEKLQALQLRTASPSQIEVPDVARAYHSHRRVGVSEQLETVLDELDALVGAVRGDCRARHKSAPNALVASARETYT